MDELARKVGQALKDSRDLLVTAESCTGGWVAEAVTAIAGSSEWFERGFVAYSDAAKRDLLEVKGSTLKKHGAVSEQTAREMALGALARSQGSLALSVTGVAGPGGSPWCGRRPLMSNGGCTDQPTTTRISRSAGTVCDATTSTPTSYSPEARRNRGRSSGMRTWW